MRKPFKITEVIDEGRDIKTFLFDEGVEATPGQFVMAWLPQIKVEKPLSLSYASPLGITVKKREISESSFTPTLFGLKEGDKVWLSEPKGNGFPMSKLNSSEVYLVGGGTGTAPLSFLAERLENSNITSFIGAKSFDQILFEERFRKHGKAIIIATEDGSKGEKGLVTDALKNYENVLSTFSKNRKAVVCGPEKMEYFSAQILGEHLNHDDIFISIERYMKCAIGLCGVCAFGPYRDCADGPIFTYTQAKAVPDFGKFRKDRAGVRDPTFS